MIYVKTEKKEDVEEKLIEVIELDKNVGLSELSKVIQVGDHLLFKSNKFKYFQDMKMHTGIQEGIIFTINSIRISNKAYITMIADGYGSDNYYGNGPVTISADI